MTVPAHAQLGEGPVWVEREMALYWVDIAAPAIWRHRPGDGTTECWTPPFRVTALAPRLQGGFVAATALGFAFIDPAATHYELLTHPEPDKPGNRFNDGAVDAWGGFWAGTMDDSEQAITGALYRLDPQREWQCLERGYGVPNGPAFSPDGRTGYHADSVRRRLYRFTLDATGFPVARETFLQFEEADGYPDGMTTDRNGNLWVCFWDGGCVRGFDPVGHQIGRLDVPVTRPTSCAFGGAELDRLYITSARVGLSSAQRAAQPDAGALFAVPMNVPGWRLPEFRG